jgi:integrase
VLETAANVARAVILLKLFANKEVILNLSLYTYLAMKIRPLLASVCASLDDFLGQPMAIVEGSGASAVAILDANQPVFYVVSPEFWKKISQQDSPGRLPRHSVDVEDLNDNEDEEPAPAPRSPRVKTVRAQMAESVLTQGAMRFNRFDVLADQLIEIENQRVKRGELSAASVGILKNRLDAHVLPYFKYIPPSQVTPMMMDAFVRRLTDSRLSSTTVSQYLVVVRKLLKLAIRHGFLREVPELPSIKVANRPRSMLSLKEYAAVVHTAHRLARTGDKAPEIKASTGYRERFWVHPRHLSLPPDMAWAIRFMVNSFVRPGDLRQLKHKHVQVVRGSSVYLRMTLPQTKRHDAPMVTLRPAVQVYESALAKARQMGQGEPDDYVFLPAEKDRTYALAVLGFWFKWVMREAGVAPADSLGRLRTLYCLRHTSIMFRLLYGQGIDMLTLARNARTSVQMIERFYASALDGEMNVAMLQSRRTSKS